LKSIVIAVIFILFNASYLAAKIENDTVNKQIKTPPQLISKPVLKFPDMAVKAGLADTIYVKVFIGKDGHPFRTDIIKRNPEFVYLFDNDVRKWAMKVVFSPARDDNDEPVRSAVVFPVIFKLTDFKPPEIREQPNPDYPEEALEMGLEGWVAVAVLVNTSGLPEGTSKVVSREPFSTDVFDKAALDVANKTKFIPASSGGHISYGWKFIKIEFKLPAK
jgi:TonB family protein